MSSKSSDSQTETITINIQPFITPIAMLLSVIILSVSLVLGMDNIANSIEEQEVNFAGVAGAADNNGNAPSPSPTPSPAAPSAAAPSGSVPIDGDPYLGDKDSAKVAVVEFTDYECPFCQRHEQQTAGQIVDNFVEGGDVIYVTKNFPLSFHNPAATNAAIMAECVLEDSGNSAYYDFKTGYFAAGEISGARDAMLNIVDDIGADRGSVANCYDAAEKQADVDEDMAEGTAVGISGTPGFCVGVINGDEVECNLISGAQPYSVFEQAIEAALDEA